MIKKFILMLILFPSFLFACIEGQYEQNKAQFDYEGAIAEGYSVNEIETYLKTCEGPKDIAQILTSIGSTSQSQSRLIISFAIALIIFVIFVNKKANKLKAQELISDNKTMQTKKRGIPKRWFDLIATLIAAIYIYVKAWDLFDYQEADAWGILLALTIIFIALRRFFYGKKE